MKNKQRALFFIVMFCIVGILGYRWWDTNVSPNITRNIEKNTKNDIVLKGPGNYIVGKNGFETGYYDIVSKHGLVETNAFVIGENQKILNYHLYKSSEISIGKKDELELKASEFKPLEFKNQICELVNTTGYFRCGQEMESGEYIFTIKSADPKYKIFIQLEDEELKVVENKTIKKNEEYIIKVEENQYINIHNITPELGDFTIQIRRD